MWPQYVPLRPDSQNGWLATHRTCGQSRPAGRRSRSGRLLWSTNNSVVVGHNHPG